MALSFWTEWTKRGERRLLKTFLLVGGFPPILSGLEAGLAPEAYLNGMGPALDALFGEETYPLLVFMLQLQGGDAFVAGAGRVLVALMGRLRLMRWMAGVGILHSGFEIWLLPQRLLGWSHDLPGAEFSTLLDTLVWSFVALHILLVLGYSTALAWGALAPRPEQHS
jgi:hypothetical protein